MRCSGQGIRSAFLELSVIGGGAGQERMQP